jgi:hypothetical protein
MIFCFARAHWHGEIAVRIVKPNSKVDEAEFLNQFKNQVCLNNQFSFNKFFFLGISITKSST